MKITMTEEQQKRMEQLVDELNRASEAYYNGRQELMTDYEWDARFDELKRLEMETGTTLPADTARVGRQHSRPKRRARVPCLVTGQNKTSKRFGEVG